MRTIEDARAWLAEAEAKLKAAKKARLDVRDRLAYQRLKISVGVRWDMVRRLERAQRRAQVGYDHHA